MQALSSIDSSIGSPRYVIHTVRLYLSLLKGIKYTKIEALVHSSFLVSKLLLILFWRYTFLFQSLDTPNHSYAWTSVVIPGAQHTLQESYKNKASFIVTQLEEEVDYQVQVQAKNIFGWGKVS